MKSRLLCLVSCSSLVALLASGCLGKNSDDRRNPRTDTVPDSVEPLLATFAGAGATITEVAAPLSQSGVSADSGETTAKSDVQEGLGGNRSDGDQPAALSDPACVSFAWAGLTATVTYDQCVSEETGAVIDGGITVGMTLIPVSFSITFDNLTIGPNLFDGTVSLTFRGTAPNITTELAFDLVVDDGTNNSIDLDQATLTVATGSVTVDGTGTFSNANSSSTFTATQVNWSGDCLPTSGTVDFDDGTFFGTAEFLPTTPTLGEVRIIVPPFIDSVEPILAPGCASN